MDSGGGDFISLPIDLSLHHLVMDEEGICDVADSPRVTGPVWIVNGSGHTEVTTTYGALRDFSSTEVVRLLPGRLGVLDL